MQENNIKEDIYTKEGRRELEEEDQIVEDEEGFMEGYEQGEVLSKCANCGKVLIDEKFVEEEFNGELFRFCSNECANSFEVGKK
ncbi:hypothetical protein J4216_03875 [Candidatus Woesearchaeota archaeon]|nr:hypothetical protein [Candidatus Woesearchaeota archaeon]